MNVIEFKQTEKQDIVYCMVDITSKSASYWIREIVKNIADYTVNNITAAGYDVYQGLDEDTLLKTVSKLNYTHAVVFTTGTEFLNGHSFFDAAKELIKQDFFLAGHVLDRKEAYYELHSQCYIVNLEKYNLLNCPIVGQQELGQSHQQIAPWRSLVNYHDDYTPISVLAGDVPAHYNHRCHGWNILSTAFNANQQVVVFQENIRSSKKHYYPEIQAEFNKNVGYLYKRQSYCAASYVHKKPTDVVEYLGPKIKQLITPASGSWFTEHLDPEGAVVIVYDYNTATLDYWRNNVPSIPNVSYQFVEIDLLGDDTDWTSIIRTDLSVNTLFNATNIFAYEGTAAFASLSYRIYRENLLIKSLQNIIPQGQIMFNRRAWEGYKTSVIHNCCVSECEVVEMKDLKLPTWHLVNFN